MTMAEARAWAFEYVDTRKPNLDADNPLTAFHMAEDLARYVIKGIMPDGERAGTKGK